MFFSHLFSGKSSINFNLIQTFLSFYYSPFITLSVLLLTSYMLKITNFNVKNYKFYHIKIILSQFSGHLSASALLWES